MHLNIKITYYKSIVFKSYIYKLKGAGGGGGGGSSSKFSRN